MVLAFTLTVSRQWLVGETALNSLTHMLVMIREHFPLKNVLQEDFWWPGWLRCHIANVGVRV